MTMAVALLMAMGGGDYPTYFDWCDWEILVERIGIDSIPTGDGVIVAQVEGSSSEGNYMPNEDDSEFEDNYFWERSGGSSGSSHATTVGKKFYGDTQSMAPDIWMVNCWNATNWLQGGFLNSHLGSNTPPEYTGLGTIKVWNHSWVGSFGNAGEDRDALRRLDWVIETDPNEPVVCVGLNNGSTPKQLLTWAYNVIAVGRSDGDHAIDSPASGIDGSNRHACDLVGPLFTTSESCGVVSAAAAMLVEQSGLEETDLPAEVVKAILMAAADHIGPADGGSIPWGNNVDTSGPRRGSASEPLDPIMGAGRLNVNHAHLIMGGGDQPGSSDAPSSPVILPTGWAFESIDAAGEQYWLIEATGTIDNLSVILTWNRTVSSNFNTPSLASLDIELLRIDAHTGLPIGLVGDAGLPIFQAGTIRSVASGDNVEHLYVQGIAPGRYLIHVNRTDDDGGAEAAVAWHMTDPVVQSDLTGDGLVGVIDLLVLLQHWGLCDRCYADLEGSGYVDLTDLSLLLDAWSH